MGNDVSSTGITEGIRLNGRYLLSERLGSGAFGDVYRAMDEDLERPVAVKVLRLRPDMDAETGEMVRERFQREAKILARVDHINIVTIHDRGSHEGVPFIVMEFLAGQNLQSVISGRGALPVGEVVEYGAQIATGLQHAHRAEIGIVHRDLKPANLMLLPEGRVKICDFGLVAQPKGAVAQITRTGQPIGTAAYMSPEQARGLRVNTPSDIFSFGSVLYAMLTGEPPFPAPMVAVAMHQIVNESPEPLAERRPEVPPPLVGLLEWMLAKAPADRPDAVEVAKALNALRSPETVSASFFDGASAAPVAPPVKSAPAPRSSSGSDDGGPGHAPPRPSPSSTSPDPRLGYTPTEFAPRGSGEGGGAPAAAASGPPAARPIPPQPTAPPSVGASGPSGPAGPPLSRAELGAEVWPTLEDAERMLTARRFPDAEALFALAARNLHSHGADTHPAMFAAQFGQVRALEGQGQQSAAAEVLGQVTGRIGKALGQQHRLTRAVKEHAGR